MKMKNENDLVLRVSDSCTILSHVLDKPAPGELLPHVWACKVADWALLPLMLEMVPKLIITSHADASTWLCTQVVGCDVNL